MPTNSQISNDPDLKTFPARDAAFTVRTRLKDGSVRVAERPFEAMSCRRAPTASSRRTEWNEIGICGIGDL